MYIIPIDNKCIYFKKMFNLYYVTTFGPFLVVLGFAEQSIVIRVFFLDSGLWGYWHYGHSWPIVPASGDSEDDCGEADEM
jgi:hypothetical protein